jgi:hypothetical protein
MGKWIKVDTELLRSYSGGYKEHSAIIGKSGEKSQNSILMVANAMPDYDGNLQKAARGDALEMGKQCKELSAGFMDDSDSLIRVAKAFEDVDGQTVKILGDCQETSSKAYFLDQGGDPGLWGEPGTVTNPDGSITTTTSEVIVNPDGSRSTLITVRTTFPDGTAEETKTLKTERVIDSETAEKWNQNAEDAKLYFKMSLSILLGFSAELYVGLNLLPLIGEGLAEAAGFLSDAIVDLGTEKTIESIADATPERGWEGGDTITNTIIVETTYDRDGTPILEEVNNTTVVTNKSGEVVSSDTTGT